MIGIVVLPLVTRAQATQPICR